MFPVVFKMGQPRLFFVFSQSFQTNSTIFRANQREKMSFSSSVWCQDSNPWPFENESSPITTRPGLSLLLPYMTLTCLFSPRSSSSSKCSSSSASTSSSVFLFFLRAAGSSSAFRFVLIVVCLKEKTLVRNLIMMITTTTTYNRTNIKRMQTLWRENWGVLNTLRETWTMWCLMLSG